MRACAPPALELELMDRLGLKKKGRLGLRGFYFRECAENLMIFFRISPRGREREPRESRKPKQMRKILSEPSRRYGQAVDFKYQAGSLALNKPRGALLADPEYESHRKMVFGLRGMV